MCGRFTLTEEKAGQIAPALGVSADSLADYRQRYNIALTDQHWMVRTKREDRELLHARWGLVNSWAKDGKRAAQQINARAETLERPSRSAAASPVSPRANSVKNDDPGVLEGVASAQLI